MEDHDDAGKVSLFVILKERFITDPITLANRTWVTTRCIMDFSNTKQRVRCLIFPNVKAMIHYETKVDEGCADDDGRITLAHVANPAYHCYNESSPCSSNCFCFFYIPSRSLGNP